MSKWELTEEAFNTLLSRLDPDREVAGIKYKDIQRRLIALFDARGCEDAEDLADETLNRFARRLTSMHDPFSGDPVPYLLAIARNLYLEHLRGRTRPLPEGLAEAPAPGGGEEEARVHDCLEKCLRKLGPRARALVLDYYREDKQAKIDFRKRLAEQSGITLGVLRLRIHRIRRALHDCITGCLSPGLPEMD